LLNSAEQEADSYTDRLAVLVVLAVPWYGDGHIASLLVLVRKEIHTAPLADIGE